MSRPINPLQCIIPPHMLKNMYANGSAAQKQVAVKAVVASARLRGERQALSRGIDSSRPCSGGW